MADVSAETLRDDAEARLDFLAETGVLDIDEDDSVAATAEFEDVRGVYADTYTDIDDEGFAETLADVFDTSVEQARTQIEETDLTRADLVAYLSLQSYLDRELPRDVLALLASMVSGVGVESAVPDSMPELDDDTYAAFVERERDAVVFVWTYPCGPCRSLKEDLPELLDLLPESVAVAGVDGDEVGRLRGEYDVTSAPTLLLFADGTLAEKIEGYYPLVDVAVELEDVYEDVTVDVEEF